MKNELSAEVVVDLQNVNLVQSGKLILGEVNLQIRQGEFIYLIGKTGTGKSTLLTALYGETPIRSGHAEVCGFQLRDMKNSQIPYLRRKLGFVFQDFQLLFDRNVYDNLVFALRATGWENNESLRARIADVLSEVGLTGREKKMPQQLSGGEQQRLVIARSILNNPPLILADEPTGNLDPETSEEVMRLLIKVNREHNTAILMATHNYQIIDKYPSKIYSCRDQSVIEERGIRMS